MNPAEYFDFWLGEWDLTWMDDENSRGYGTNRIEYILDGKVIREQFEATDGNLEGYTGRSWSVFNPSDGEWKQTWVDNQGGYLDFTGEVEDGKRMFIRQGVNRDGKEITQRMVFYDINEDSFTWDWEVSEDGGESWQLQWRIHYTRRMPDH